MRIVTALVGIPIVVFLTWLGGWAFASMVAIIAVAAQHELYGLARARGSHVGGPLALATGACVVLGPMHPGLAIAAVAGFLALLATWPLKGRVEGALAGSAGTAFGLVYPPALLAAVVALRTTPVTIPADPFVLTIGLFILVWSADSGAYYAGRTLGRRLLAPNVSPKKTWEGFAGGIVVTLLAAFVLDRWAEPDLGLAHWLVLAGISAVVGPVGDLFESALKRDADVKDSASILPGHGGFLDRFDGLAFVAPMAYLYLHFVAGIFG